MLKYSRIKRSNLFINISQLAIGSLIAQLFVLVASPILTRLFSPEELGSYSLVVTFISLFSPVICGRYELSIVTSNDEKEVLELIKVCFVITIILSFVATIIYVYFINFNNLGMKQVEFTSILIFPILLLFGVGNILSAYNNRKQQYKLMSKVYIIRSLGQNCFMIISGLLNFGIIGLTFSQLFGAGLGLKLQANELIKRIKEFKEINNSNLIKVVRKYKDQFFFSFPAQLVNSSSYTILNFFIAFLFGLEILGFYSMAFRILTLPLTLISQNVSKVFFQKASEEFTNTGMYYLTVKRVLWFLTCIAVPMVIILIALGPWVFTILFGKSWSETGVYVQLLAPMYGVRLVVSSLSPALIISNKQNVDLLMQSLFMVASLGAFVISKYFIANILFFLLLITISYTLIYLLFLRIILKLSKESRRVQI